MTIQQQQAGRCIEGCVIELYKDQVHELVSTLHFLGEIAAEKIVEPVSMSLIVRKRSERVRNRISLQIV